MKVKRLLVLMMLPLLLLVFPACSDDDDSSNNDTPPTISDVPATGQVSIALSAEDCGANVVRAAAFMGIGLSSPSDTINTTLPVGSYVVTGTILNTATGLSNQLQSEFQIQSGELTTIRLDCSGFRQL